MNDSISVIGGADGPASIFLAGRIGISWLNILGLIIIVLLLIPNIIYALKEKNQENRCTNKLMNILEQIGRYGSMFLMVFNIGIAEFGFSSVGAFFVYLFGNILLLISYWLIWVMFFKKKTYQRQMALAIIPTGIFLLSGIAMLHYLLILFAVIFGIGHIYVTSKNRV
ncbi:MAG: hypothetical protein J6X94_10105 [Lachnospiraceae bacterium]|nr:hypothetical protein [Lachnospiraceae bacterium]